MLLEQMKSLGCYVYPIVLPHVSQASEACIIRRSLGIQHNSMFMLKRKGPTHEQQDKGCNPGRSDSTGFLHPGLVWGEWEVRHWLHAAE